MARKLWIVVLFSIAVFVYTSDGVDLAVDSSKGVASSPDDDLDCFETLYLLTTYERSFDGIGMVSFGRHENAGEWRYEKVEGTVDKATKSSWVTKLRKQVILKRETIVIQFDVGFPLKVECGGACVKFIGPQDAGWVPSESDKETPYSVKFGPHICGSTSKIEFILKLKNPKSGRVIQLDLKSPPSVPSDRKVHLYTAIISPQDNELKILVDGKEQRTANFLSEEDFEAAIIPSETMAGRDDKKPEDWDERTKVPEANKPDDVNEGPQEIENPEYEKIAALGVEISSMRQDSVYINHVQVLPTAETARLIRFYFSHPQDLYMGIREWEFIAKLLYSVENLCREAHRRSPNSTIGKIYAAAIILVSAFLTFLAGKLFTPKKLTRKQRKKAAKEAAMKKRNDQNEDPPFCGHY